MQAKIAEDAGLEGLFAPQVYGPPFIPLAAAAVTHHVRLASGVALAFVRSPLLAHAGQAVGVLGCDRQHILRVTSVGAQQPLAHRSVPQVRPVVAAPLRAYPRAT